MLLLVDAGNTRVKWALARPGLSMPGNWIASGNVAHDKVGELDQYWQDADIDTVVASNVAGKTMQAALEQQFFRLRGSSRAPDISWFVSQAVAGGIYNGYREPDRLGCDRLASMIGARAMRPQQPLIVVTCGTATTIDAIDADGHFIGGLILPGLGTMATSLAQKTAQLPLVTESGALSYLARQDLAQQNAAGHRASPFADNTEDAIMRGCLTAQTGAIEHAVVAHGRAHCLLSGGAAAWILPYLTLDLTLVENLVLTGLHTVAIAQVARGAGAAGAYASC